MSKQSEEVQIPVWEWLWGSMPIIFPSFSSGSVLSAVVLSSIAAGENRKLQDILKGVSG